MSDVIIKALLIELEGEKITVDSIHIPHRFLRLEGFYHDLQGSHTPD